MKVFQFLFFISLFLLTSFIGFSQKIESDKLHQLSGIIKDNNKIPAPFVHILVKNYKRGTISDFGGFFSLVVDVNDTLMFSSIGYEKQIYIVPDTINSSDFYIEVTLKKDTIVLAEAVVFPWNTYAKFKEAFIALKAPRDDIDRAIKNFELIEKQLLNGDLGPDARLSYKVFMEQTYNQLYYAGQLPPNTLLNPVAWSQFFKALKDGDFKKKD